MKVYCIATVVVVPAALMMIGAGFVFSSAFGMGTGILLAIISSFFGAYLSAIISFFIARFIIRKFIKKITRKYTLLTALDTAVKQNGFRVFVLLRISPLIPFNAVNYMAGASSVSFREYLMSLFALIPGISLGVIIGASLGSLTEADGANNKATTIGVSVTGSIFSLIALVIVTFYARKELRKAACDTEIPGDSNGIVDENSETEDCEENLEGGINKGNLHSSNVQEICHDTR